MLSTMHTNNSKYFKTKSHQKGRGTKRVKKAFVEDPMKAIFLDGFACRPGQDWEAYREICYQDLQKAVHCYIKRFDLPKHSKHGYLHLETSAQAENFLIKKRVRLAGCYIAVHKYQKTDEQYLREKTRENSTVPSRRETGYNTPKSEGSYEQNLIAKNPLLSSPGSDSAWGSNSHHSRGPSSNAIFTKNTMVNQLKQQEEPSFSSTNPSDSRFISDYSTPKSDREQTARENQKLYKCAENLINTREFKKSITKIFKISVDQGNFRNEDLEKEGQSLYRQTSQKNDDEDVFSVFETEKGNIVNILPNEPTRTKRIQLQPTQPVSHSQNNYSQAHSNTASVPTATGMKAQPPAYTNNPLSSIVATNNISTADLVQTMAEKFSSEVWPKIQLPTLSTYFANAEAILECILQTAFELYMVHQMTPEQISLSINGTLSQMWCQDLINLGCISKNQAALALSISSTMHLT